jgi:hypothetical protein
LQIDKILTHKRHDTHNSVLIYAGKKEGCDMTSLNQEPEHSDAQEPKSVSENIKSRTIWWRLFFMLVIAFIWGVSRFVIGVVVMVQFFWVLFTGDTNADLKKFGHQLALYSLQVIEYLTFNTEDRPFPFDLKWPND